MKPIPVKAAEYLAKTYGYDQVIIYARKVGEAQPHGEHMTTYGTNIAHCGVAARIGKYLQQKIMGWTFDEDQKKLYNYD